MSDGIEIPPTLRMADSILGFVQTFFTESGCPLSSEQAAALEGARDATRQQVTTIRTKPWLLPSPGGP
jgi:hypothetical protein